MIKASNLNLELARSKTEEQFVSQLKHHGTEAELKKLYKEIQLPSDKKDVKK